MVSVGTSRTSCHCLVGSGSTFFIGGLDWEVAHPPLIISEHLPCCRFKQAKASLVFGKHVVPRGSFRLSLFRGQDPERDKVSMLVSGFI